MSKIDIQDQLCSVLTGLFRDPKEARHYAEDPHAYLNEKVGRDVDYREVDMKQVVEYAVAETEVGPDIADAMYQPAPTLRVPPPKAERIEERLEDRRAERVEERLERAEEFDPEPPIVRGDPIPPTDQPAHTPDAPPVVERPQAERPQVEYPQVERPQVEYPKDAPVEKVDGYYKATPPEGATPAADYTPTKYTPDCEIDQQCVEYSISNCVTEVYKAEPAIADKLCETRDFTDPYPRKCAEDGYEDAITYIEKPIEPKMDDAHKMDDAKMDDGHKMDDAKMDDAHKADEPTMEKAPEYEKKVEYEEKDPMDLADRDGIRLEREPDGTFQQHDAKMDEPKMDDAKMAEPKMDEPKMAEPKMDEAHRMDTHQDEDWGNGHTPDPKMGDAHKMDVQKDEDWGDGDKAVEPIKHDPEPAMEMAPEPIAYEAPVEEITYPEDQAVESAPSPMEADPMPMEEPVDDMVEG